MLPYRLRGGKRSPKQVVAIPGAQHKGEEHSRARSVEPSGFTVAVASLVIVEVDIGILAVHGKPARNVGIHCVCIPYYHETIDIDRERIA